MAKIPSMAYRLKLMDLEEALGKIKECIKKDGIIMLPHAQDKIDGRQITDLKGILKNDIRGIEQQIHDDGERYVLTYSYDDDKDLKVVIK